MIFIYPVIEFDGLVLHEFLFCICDLQNILSSGQQFLALEGFGVDNVNISMHKDYHGKRVLIQLDLTIMQVTRRTGLNPRLERSRPQIPLSALRGKARPILEWTSERAGRMQTIGLSLMAKVKLIHPPIHPRHSFIYPTYSLTHSFIRSFTHSYACMLSWYSLFKDFDKNDTLNILFNQSERWLIFLIQKSLDEVTY